MVWETRRFPNGHLGLKAAHLWTQKNKIFTGRSQYGSLWISFAVRGWQGAGVTGGKGPAFLPSIFFQWFPNGKGTKFMVEVPSHDQRSWPRWGSSHACIISYWFFVGSSVPTLCCMSEGNHRSRCTKFQGSAIWPYSSQLSIYQHALVQSDSSPILEVVK